MTRLTATGTYRGGVEDIPSTAVIGKLVRVAEILIHRISSGKVAEGWMEFEQLGLWRQLGVIPLSEEGKGSVPMFSAKQYYRPPTT